MGWYFGEEKAQVNTDEAKKENMLNQWVSWSVLYFLS